MKLVGNGETVEIRKGSYRAYCVPTEDKEDLRQLVAHLPDFLDTAIANGKQMIVEIWYETVPSEHS